MRGKTPEGISQIGERKTKAKNYKVKIRKMEENTKFARIITNDR
jgi:hypothetical protein